MEDVMTALMPKTVQPGLLRLLREDVSCVFQRDPAARSRFEVLTTYPGVHAILMQRLAHRLWKFGLRYPARPPRSATTSRCTTASPSAAPPGTRASAIRRWATAWWSAPARRYSARSR